MTPIDDPREAFNERRVTYTTEMDGRVYPVENVTARIDSRTCDKRFSPETVEQLHRTIREGETPVRFIETPVF